MRKGFTLIELLVVVGILGVLAVAALIAINPAEAQRKSRDSARMKDIVTLQTAIEQRINDGGAPTAAVDVTSTSGSTSCTSGWLTLDVCQYLKALPLDPMNNKNVGYINIDSSRTVALGQYNVYVSMTGEYAVSARLESVANISKLAADGSPSDAFFSAFSSTAVIGNSTF